MPVSGSYVIGRDLMKSSNKIRKRLNRALVDVLYNRGILRGIGYPYCLMLEPTNVCNLSCPLCPTGSGNLRREKGFMDYSVFSRISNELAPFLYRANLWGFGEPTLHPRLNDMVSDLEKKGVRTTVSTNGTQLMQAGYAEEIVRSGLSDLQISLDGVSEASYCKYRKGGSFDEVLRGIKLIIETKEKLYSKHPYITIQFIVMRHNEHEINRIREIAAELDVRLKLKPVCVGPKDELGMLPTDQSFSRYANSNDPGVLKAGFSSPRVCPYPWFWATINWDGSAVPCCKDPHGDHLLGKITSEDSFYKVWTSREYISFRRRCKLDKQNLRRCRRCVLPSPTTGMLSTRKSTK